MEELGWPTSKINISSTMRNHMTCHLPLERAWRGLSSYEGLTCIDKDLHSYFLQFVQTFMKWLEFFLMTSSCTFMASRATTPTNASKSSSMTSRGAIASPCWHQWQLHQQSPPLSLMTTTHAPPMSMLPFCLHLSLCLHFSPFGINGKGCPYLCLKSLITTHFSPC